jgi:hypothetical protein
MSTIVNILLEPVLSGLGSGSATWPTLGAVLDWFLVAALLGMLLHRLREPTGSVRRDDLRLPLRSRAMRGKNFLGLPDRRRSEPIASHKSFGPVSPGLR